MKNVISWAAHLAGWIIVCLVNLAPSAHAAVGRTPGNFAVSATGAATYSIPLWAPPGPNGLQPSIALTYDSQSGMSYTGMGWGVSGLGSVYRCNQTVAEDGAATAVALSYTDRFCLDGKRLRLTSSENLATYGQDGTTYQTEVADFSNVTAHGSAGNGPAYFTVQGRNGWQYQYGNGGNSQVLANGSTTAVAWWLNQVTDRAGNTMLITYQPANENSNLEGTTVPASISWTPSSYGATTYNYTMDFSYQTLTSPVRAGYIAGTPVQNYYLLNNITIQSSGSTVKAYVFSYTASATTSRETLTSLQECTDTTQANCLYPTQFNYQSGQSGIATGTTTLAGSQFRAGDSAVASFDFNGDGINDLAYYDSGQWWVAFGSPTGYSAPHSTGVTSQYALIASIDVSGTAAFLLQNSDTNWWYYKWNGSSFPGVSTGAPNYGYTFVDSATFADVNGDGLADIVSITGNGVIDVQLNTSSSNGISFAAPIQTITTSVASAITGQVRGGVRKLDYYGDGQSDVILEVQGVRFVQLYVLHFASNTFAVTPLAPIFTPGSLLDVGDYNDDGCVDTLLAGALYLAACNGSPAVRLSFGTLLAVAGMNWDGSGRREVVVNNGGTLGIYPIIGTSLGNLIPTTIPYVSTNVYGPLPNLAGDGSEALAVFNGASSAAPIQYYLHNSPGQPPDLLSSVTDGYGNSTSPGYVSILQSNYAAVFNPADAQPIYPYRLYTGPLYVVNQATFSDPSSATAGATYQQTFSYYNAWTNMQGLGFTGFNQMQHYDSRIGNWETVGYGGPFPYNTHIAFDLLSHDQAGNQLIRFNSYNYPTVLLDSTANNQRWFVYFDTARDQTFEVGGSKNGQLIKTETTGYTYDNYGNSTTVSRTVTDNDGGSPYSGVSWTITTTNTPDVDLANWCLSLLSQTQTTYTASSGDPSVTRTRSFTPDTTQCRYNEIVTQPNSSTYKVTEDLLYDNFGNISTDTITGIGMAPRQTTVNWGTTGQFPMSQTDSSGALTQFNYNLNYGLLSSRTDANNLTTSWVYGDGFGRVTQENQPGGTAVGITYNSCQPPNTCDPLWRSFVLESLLDKSGNVITRGSVTYDALERPIEVDSLSLAGSASTVITNYDSLGRVAGRTEPFFFGATQYLETYSYDALSRLTQSQRPTSAANTSPQQTTYQYAGDTYIVTDANQHPKTLVRDSNGWLRRTQDATGYTIVLGYDAAGSKTSVTDSTGNSLWSGVIQYGAAPFAVSSTDADLGTWTYTYDALGDLTAWTDAKSQHFSASYDALSRMTDRYEPDLYTHWTWGTGAINGAPAYNVGQLQAVCTGTGTNPTTCTGSPGYAEGEAYDTLGRLNQRSIQIPGDATYTYGWAYSSSTGLLDTLTYPTVNSYSLRIQYAYQNGLLQSLTDVSDTPNVTLWTANATNPAGVPTQETLGNGVVVTHALDAVTGWPSSITAGVGNGAALQNNSYLFDLVGNLTQRQDNNAGVTENVYPDVLDRLDHTVGDSSTAMAYDAMGRLSAWGSGGTADNVNDYTTPQSGCTYYANSQLHAVRKKTQGTGVASFCYDANGNLTSSTWRAAAVSAETWTSYNQPNLLTGGWPTITTGTSTSQFFYDHNHQRWKQVASYSGTPETTEYIGGLLEKMTNSSGTAYRHYVAAGNNYVVYTRTDSAANPVYYVTKDHLGSSAVITDSAGALVVNEKFAALGWNENTGAEQAAIATVTRHEFTGQEGLDNPGLWLVDMNGRVYLPSGGMFLSPDPYIPDPTSTIGYNRYAYVNYNPLTNIDPSGFDDFSPSELYDLNNNPSATFYFANGGVFQGGLGFAAIGLDTVPNVQTRTFNFGNGDTFSQDQQHVTFYAEGTAYEVGDFNAQSGKFTWFDGFTPSAGLESAVFQNYAPFGLQLQAAAQSSLHEVRNTAITVGAGEILAAGIGVLAARGITSFAGHGIETVMAGTTVVPDGVALTLPGRAGLLMPDTLGRLIEAGDWAAIAANPRYAALMEGTTTFLPGAEVPNLILQPSVGLTTLPGSVTVSEDTLLSTLLSGARGLCVWAACRAGP